MLVNYKKYLDAKKYALEAIKLRSDWGKPYILLANIYATGPKCGENEFELKWIYWIAVDKLLKAKAVDSDLAATVNPMISSFSQHFPKKEDAFFYGVNEGDTVNVGCWIGESTKARFTN
jgi:hypothetical protein